MSSNDTDTDADPEQNNQDCFDRITNTVLTIQINHLPEGVTVSMAVYRARGGNKTIEFQTDSDDELNIAVEYWGSEDTTYNIFTLPEDKSEQIHREADTFSEALAEVSSLYETS